MDKNRNKFLDYKLPLREVNDRTIGKFEHSVESLRQNSIAIITLPNFGEVGIISKARNYSTTPYDIMVSSLNDEKSVISELSDVEREEFFGLVDEVYTVLQDKSGMKIAIGFNQHPKGLLIPEIDEYGNKNRVQTLRPMHIHLYEYTNPEPSSLRMGDIPKEDQRDICDPLLSITCDILQNKLQHLPEFNKFNYSLSIGDSPPWGLNIELPYNLNNLLSNNSAILGQLQAINIETYLEWESLFTQENSAQEKINRLEILADSYRVTNYTRSKFRHLLSNLRPSKEVIPSLIYTKGAAFSYTLFERNNTAVISVHPRIMSKGNSADAFGLYVNNNEGEDTFEMVRKRILYRCIIDILSEKREVVIGKFMEGD